MDHFSITARYAVHTVVIHVHNQVNMHVVSLEIARLGKAYIAFWSVMDSSALRHVPIALCEMEEITEMYHQ